MPLSCCVLSCRVYIVVGTMKWLEKELRMIADHVTLPFVRAAGNI